MHRVSCIVLENKIKFHWYKMLQLSHNATAWVTCDHIGNLMHKNSSPEIVLCWYRTLDFSVKRQPWRPLDHCQKMRKMRLSECSFLPICLWPILLDNIDVKKAVPSCFLENYWSRQTQRAERRGQKHKHKRTLRSLNWSRGTSRKAVRTDFGINVSNLFQMLPKK